MSCCHAKYPGLPVVERCPDTAIPCRSEYRPGRRVGVKCIDRSASREQLWRTGYENVRSHVGLGCEITTAVNLSAADPGGSAVAGPAPAHQPEAAKPEAAKP